MMTDIYKIIMWRTSRCDFDFEITSQIASKTVVKIVIGVYLLIWNLIFFFSRRTTPDHCLINARKPFTKFNTFKQWCGWKSFFMIIVTMSDDPLEVGHVFDLLIVRWTSQRKRSARDVLHKVYTKQLKDD